MSDTGSANPQRSLPELIEESNQLKEQSIKLREKLEQVNEQIRNRAEEAHKDRPDSTETPDSKKP